MAAIPRQPLQYPLQGLSENYGFSLQEELTSRDERNMRSIDPITGRIRGSQRAGLGVFANADTHTTSNKIKMLAATTADKVQLNYAEDLAPTALDTYAFTGLDTCVDITEDDYGNIYALSASGYIAILNEDLVEINSVALPASVTNGANTIKYYGTTEYSAPVPTCITVDPYLNIYVGTGNTSSTSPDTCAVYCLALLPDDSYKLSWTEYLFAYIEDLQYKNDALYCLTTSATGPGDDDNAATATISFDASSQPQDDSQCTINDEVSGTDTVFKFVVSGGVDTEFLRHVVKGGTTVETSAAFAVAVNAAPTLGITASATSVGAIGYVTLTLTIAGAFGNSATIATTGGGNTFITYAPFTGGGSLGHIEALSGNCTWTSGSKTLALADVDAINARGRPDDNVGSWAIRPEVGDQLYVSSASATDGLYTVASINATSVVFTVSIGATFTSEAVSLHLAPKYMVMSVAKYADADANSIGYTDDGADIAVGEPMLTFNATTQTIKYSGNKGSWPGVKPKTGDVITITGAEEPLNNGTFTVFTATYNEIYLGASAGIQNENPSDHQFLNYDQGRHHKRWATGRSKKRAPKWEYTANKSPTIRLTNRNAEIEKELGALSHVYHYGRLDVTDNGYVYITVATEGKDFVQTMGYLAQISESDEGGGMAVTKEIYNIGQAADVGGVGYEVRASPNGPTGLPTVVTCGNHFGSNTVEVQIRRWVDDPVAAGFGTTSGAGAWQRILDDGGSPTQWKIATSGGGRLRLAVDKNDGLYLPWKRGAGTTYPSSKDLIFISADNATIKAFAFAGPVSSRVLCAAVPDYAIPDYSGSAVAPSTHDWAILGGTASVGDDAGVGVGDSIFRNSLATVVQITQSPRELYVVAIAGTTIKRIPSSGTYAAVTDSALADIDGTSPYIQGVSAYSKIYITDGRNYFVYDPSVGDNGELRDWNSSSYGRIPKRCRLIELWRGRVVIAKDPEDPGAWHMSRVGDPDNWDGFPQNPSAADSISARNSKAGGVPDTINTIIPFTDDLLIFGCDASIWRLTGDPRAGGQLDLVTDQTGISFGRPWCKDPMGGLWFFGSEGGLYRMTPQGELQNLSVGRVPRSLQDIDLGSHYVSLVWNYLDEGLHIFVIPFADHSASDFGNLLDHWFYDVKNGGFHKDRFGTRNKDYIQPTAAMAVNGDLFDDRVVMMGCEDSRIRRWARDKAGNIPIDDEQTTALTIAVDSYVTSGPVTPANIQGATQITEFSALLGESQDGCNFEFFSSDNPEILGSAKASGTLSAGRNGRKLIRVSGDSVFLRMRNASMGQRWSYETGAVNIDAAGQIRRES